MQSQSIYRTQKCSPLLDSPPPDIPISMQVLTVQIFSCKSFNKSVKLINASIREMPSFEVGPPLYSTPC